MNQLKALSIGCGPVKVDGWTHADSDPAWEPDVVYDVTLPPSTWRQGPLLDRYDIIVMNHSLQQVEHNQVEKALRHVRELLVDGGCVRVLVPDVLGAFHAFENGYAHHFSVSDLHEPSLNGKFCAYLSQAGTARSFFTLEVLLGRLMDAGFRSAFTTSVGETYCEHKEILELDSRPHESIVVEGIR